jgi:hypothetical protein
MIPTSGVSLMRGAWAGKGVIVNDGGGGVKFQVPTAKFQRGKKFEMKKTPRSPRLRVSHSFHLNGGGLTLGSDEGD